jgi:hypothetical protein
MHLVLFLWYLLSHCEPEKLDEMSTARLPGLDLPWPLSQFSVTASSLLPPCSCQYHPLQIESQLTASGADDEVAEVICDEDAWDELGDLSFGGEAGSGLAWASKSTSLG